MNRRGDMAMGFLVFFTIVMCAVALFSFVSFDNDFDEKSREYQALLEGFEIREAIVEGLLDNLLTRGKDKEGIMKIVNEEYSNVELDSNVLGKLRIGKFEVVNSQEGKSLKIDGAIYRFDVGENSMVREFDFGSN